jgi:uncharacterized protein YcbK (DUF882 family)
MKACRFSVAGKEEKMSQYFSEEEIVCHCCGALPENGIDPKLYDVLDQIRIMVGKPLNVNCGYRCPKHNAEIPGSVPNSQHVLGTAADIDAGGIGVDELAAICEQVLSFFGISGGIGKYWSGKFVHCDVRKDGPARWTEND